MSKPGPTTRSKTSEQDGLSHHLKQGMPSTVSELELLVRKILEPITNAIKALPSTGYLDQKINELNNQLVEQISKQNETIKVLSDRVDNLQSEIHKLKDAREKQERRIDDLEQYGRRKCLRIIGIPTDKNETSQQVLEKVKEEVPKLGVKINPNEYDRAHRVEPKFTADDGKIHQQVIVGMTSWSARTQIYRARYNKPGNKVRFRLDLTKSRLQYLKRANSEIKKKGNSDVYAFADINCRLVIKTAANDFICFNSENELNEILKKL